MKKLLEYLDIRREMLLNWLLKRQHGGV